MRRGGLWAWLVGITAGLAVGLLAMALAALGVLLVAALIVGRRSIDHDWHPSAAHHEAKHLRHRPR
jgi:hypothetical protein